jgi:hypothetical protein
VWDAVAEYALETSAAELPIDHFLDWLVEWGREARRKQTGLLLLTAHRAKGLEFEPELWHRRVRPRLREIDIGFAGRYPEGHALHQAIAALSAGDEIGLRQGATNWELINHAGIAVGRLSRAFAPPANMHCLSAHVSAIITRSRDDGDPAQSNISRCEHWEIVMVELIFKPAVSGNA